MAYILINELILLLINLWKYIKFIRTQKNWCILILNINILIKLKKLFIKFYSISEVRICRK